MVGLDHDLVAVVERAFQSLGGLPPGRGVGEGEPASDQDGVVALGAAVAGPQLHGDRVAGDGDVEPVVRGQFVDALAQHLQPL
jgi:hypothetical protein